MATAIHHTSFPHIIDSILSTADPTTFLPFSQTSRTYRPLISSAYHHLSISITSPPPSPFTTAHTIFPFISPLQPTHRPTLSSLSPHAQRALDLPAQLPYPHPNAPSTHRINALLAHTRVLDVHAWVELSGWFRWPLPLFPSLRVIRAFTNGSGHNYLPPAHTVVLYDDVGKAKVNPAGLRRLIFRAHRCSPRESGPPGPFMRFCILQVAWRNIGRVEEVVLVGERADAAFLYWLVEDLEQSKADVGRVVLVDVEAAALDAAIARKVGQQVGDEEGDARRRLLDSEWCFLSREEYTRTLSKEEERLFLSQWKEYTDDWKWDPETAADAEMLDSAAIEAQALAQAIEASREQISDTSDTQAAQ